MDATAPYNSATNVTTLGSQDRTPFTVVHIMFMLVIVATNGLAVLLYLVDKSLHTCYNLHILSVLTIDLCAGIFAIPAAMLIHTPGLQDGHHMCKTFAFFLSLIEAADVYSMVLIAAEKYQLLVLRPATQRTLTQTLVHIGLVWTASIMYSLKDTVAYKSEHEAGGAVECRIPAEYPALGQSYVLLDALLLFCLPLIFICFCYASITLNLRKHLHSSAVSFTQNKRAVHLHMTVVVCFFFSAVGLHILRLYLAFGPGPFPNHTLCNDILTTVAFSDFWINPLLYCYFNTNFRSSWSKLRAKLDDYRGRSSSVVTPSGHIILDTLNVGSSESRNLYVVDTTQRHSVSIKEDTSSSKVFSVA